MLIKFFEFLANSLAWLKHPHRVELSQLDRQVWGLLNNAQTYFDIAEDAEEKALYFDVLSRGEALRQQIRRTKKAIRIWFFSGRQGREAELLHGLRECRTNFNRMRTLMGA